MDLPDALNMIDELRAENDGLKERLAEVDGKHAKELADVKYQHAMHLQAIEHGDCVSVKHHRAMVARARTESVNAEVSTVSSDDVEFTRPIGGQP